MTSLFEAGKNLRDENSRVGMERKTFKKLSGFFFTFREAHKPFDPSYENPKNDAMLSACDFLEEAIPAEIIDSLSMSIQVHAHLHRAITQCILEKKDEDNVIQYDINIPALMSVATYLMELSRQRKI